MKDVTVDLRPGMFDKLAKTYEYIDKTIQLTGMCPSEREIAAYLGIGKSTLWYRINKMREMGWIEYAGDKAQWRAIDCIREPKIYYIQE
jgi:Mn-dependent DtxR family transcriptional regulator